MKPLNRKSYGSIPHLPGSRVGVGEHTITQGQANIATVKKRKKDVVIVQEKLDGTNVGVALKNGVLIPLTRSGYHCKDSNYTQHKMFAKFVKENEKRFRSVLEEGYRICGEWLIEPHGTLYDLNHEPFVAFDIFTHTNKRLTFEQFNNKIGSSFIKPVRAKTENLGEAISIQDALSILGEKGKHGALELIEGAIWRVETDGKFNFICKYVRHDKEDGKYFYNKWKGDFKIY